MTLKEWETLMKERGYIPSPTPQRTFSTYEKTHSDYRIFSCYPQTFWNIIHHSSYADCFKRANYVIEHDLKNGNRQETFKISFCYQHHKGTASALVYRIETGKIFIDFSYRVDNAPFDEVCDILFLCYVEMLRFLENDGYYRLELAANDFLIHKPYQFEDFNQKGENE